MRQRRAAAAQGTGLVPVPLRRSSPLLLAGKDRGVRPQVWIHCHLTPVKIGGLYLLCSCLLVWYRSIRHLALETLMRSWVLGCTFMMTFWCCCRARTLGGNMNAVFSAHGGCKLGSEGSWVFWRLARIPFYTYPFSFLQESLFPLCSVSLLLFRVIVKSSHLWLLEQLCGCFGGGSGSVAGAAQGCVYSQQMHCFCHSKGTRRTESARANSISSASPCFFLKSLHLEPCCFHSSIEQNCGAVWANSFCSLTWTSCALIW